MAEEADNLGYGGFAEYCRLREKGIRRNAFEMLMRFVSEMRVATVVDRRKFVDWHQTYCFLNAVDACPNPLKEKLIRPTVNEWIKESHDDPLALRWSDDESSLKRAVQLNPNDEVAVGRFALAALHRIDYVTHELPHGYLGENPKADLADLQTVIALLNGHNITTFFDELREEAMRQRILIQSHLNPI